MNEKMELRIKKLRASNKELKERVAKLEREKSNLENLLEDKASKSVKRERYQETLATLGIYALEKDELEMVMHRVLQQTCLNLQLECAFVAKLNQEENRFEVIAEVGCDCEDMIIENDVKWDLGYALQKETPVSVADHREETRFAIAPFMADQDFKCSAYTTIRGTVDTHGVFCIFADERREFDRQDLQFIQVAANIVGMGIERKKTNKELEKANIQLKEEMKQKLQHQKDLLRNNIVERWELGGYLHDNLGQMLASAKIITHDIDKKMTKRNADISALTTQLNEIIDEGIEGIRNLTHDIIPVDIEEEGVAYAFHYLMRQTQKLYGVNCRLKMDSIISEIKNRKMATHLYHVVQEAMKNAVTHGEADNITVAVSRSEDKLILQVSDDGIGMSQIKEDNGKGLRIMKYRMEVLGGTFNVEDLADTGGTRVTVTAPLKDRAGEM